MQDEYYQPSQTNRGLSSQKQKRNVQEQDEFDEESEERKIQLNTRMLDNHWDPNVHKQHWRAIGITPGYKYNYSKDSGLGYKIQNKFEDAISDERVALKTRKDNFSKNSHNGKPYKYRPYKELENLNEGDVVITIEYCTNCKTHNTTTRHDEQKYLNQALSLQKEILKCFPIITVFLKPNVYDERDKSIDTQFIRQRVGAFDIQIAASHAEGETLRGCLHSKLKTGKWADHVNILSQIREYMHKTNLRIEFNLQDFDKEAVENTQMQNQNVNKLYKISIKLRPKREKVSYDRRQYDDGNSPRSTIRPTSALSRKSRSRPKSAISTVSNKSRPLSQMGGQSTTSEYDTTKDQIELMSGPTGVVEFMNIPYDVYHIEVDETNEFQQFKETIDLFEIANKQEPMDLVYELQHLNLTFLSINCTFYYEDQISQEQIIKKFAGEQSNVNYIDQGPLEKGNLEIIPLTESQEEVEDEIMEDTFSGNCEVTLTPGREYIVKITKPGYEEFQHRIILKPGFQELPCRVLRHKRPQESAQSQQRKPFQQQQQQQIQNNNRPQQRPGSGKKDVQQRPVSGNKVIQIFAFDGSTPEKQPIIGVKVQLKEQKMQRPEQVFDTNTEGYAQVSLQNVMEGTLELNHPDYLPIVQPYSTNKFDLQKQESPKFYLMRIPPQNEIQIRLVMDDFQPIFRFAIKDSNQQLITETNQQYYNIDNQQGVLKISNVNSLGGIHRIFATLDTNGKKIDFNMVKIFVIYNNQQQVIDIPKQFDPSCKFYDIGFISAPTVQFVEINAQCNEEPYRDMFIAEYKQLIDFIQTSNLDQKTILGFNAKNLQVKDDTNAEFQQIQKSLEKYSCEISKEALKHLIVSTSVSSGMFSFAKLSKKLNATKSDYWDITPQEFDQYADTHQI